MCNNVCVIMKWILIIMWNDNIMCVIILMAINDYYVLLLM